MAIRFYTDKEPLQQKYTGESDPRSHIKICEQSWSDIPEDEWVHLFIHTLDTVPRNWYTETELHRGMITWLVMIDIFLLTFTFEYEYPSIDQALEIIKTKIFDDCTLPVYTHPDWAIQLEHALECYNFVEEPSDEDKNPRNINIPKSKGTRKVDGPKLEIPAITKPIKIKDQYWHRNITKVFLYWRLLG